MNGNHTATDLKLSTFYHITRKSSVAYCCVSFFVQYRFCHYPLKLEEYSYHNIMFTANSVPYLLQKQQLLQDEYNRGLAEDQRLAAELARNAGGQDIEHDRQRQLAEERRREYQDFLAQVRSGLFLY